MIKITGNKDHSIFYECDCGVKGQCLVRPLGDSKALIVNVKCAMCGSSSRVVLIQQEEKAKLANNPEDIEYSGAFVTKNSVI